MEADLFEQLLSWEGFVGHNKLKQFFLGREVYKATREEVEAASKKCENLSILHKLLCLISAMIGEAEFVEWNGEYRKITGEKVQKFYTVLEQYGFQFTNKEEKSVIDGTSNLYE